MYVQVLHVGRAIPILSQLRSFLLAAYPQEYAEREAEERSSAAATHSTETSLPLFVMATMLPGMESFPTVFLVKKSRHRFGMLIYI